jgi:sorbitol/mannitol transport system substrate-binding protein
MKSKTWIIGAGLASAAIAAVATGALAQSPVTVAIATVNNSDMKTMESLTSEFEKAYPDIKLKWNVLPENELRQKVTTDIATNAGSYDVATIGTYEVPIWAKNGWLNSMDSLFEKNANVKANYDLADLITPIRLGLSYNKTLYALPFYGESSMTFYNKAAFDAAKLTMPVKPTWNQIQRFAAKLHNPKKGFYGICLRGLPGWGENMAVFSTMVNTFGGRWFDPQWNATINTPAWKTALTFYVNLQKKYGVPGVTGNGYTESLTLMSQNKCGVWIDGTPAAGFLKDPKQSKIVDSVGFANAPTGPGTPKGSNWLWSWSLAIPKSSKVTDAAFKFATWATSKEYIALVAKNNGTWASVPPGTRYSTYANPEYKKAAGDFAGLTLDAINRADPTNATKDPVPYTGVQYVGIPEFQALGAQVGQYVAGALAGQYTIDEALKLSQTAAEKVAKEGGYKK